MEKKVPSSIKDILEPLVNELVITSVDNAKENKVTSGMFKFKHMSMNFVETRLGSVNVLVFNLLFSYVLKNKTTKDKINETINSFNKDKPGIKAILIEQKKNAYVISFRCDTLYLSGDDENQCVESFVKASIPIVALAPTLFSQQLNSKNIEHQEIKIQDGE